MEPPHRYDNSQGHSPSNRSSEARYTGRKSPDRTPAHRCAAIDAIVVHERALSSGEIRSRYRTARYHSCNNTTPTGCRLGNTIPNHEEHAFRDQF